jgi:2,5-diamino-6-(ribosylamino)-4(3H)-pyrimidinone 5'-phosphate reductase
VHVAVNAAVSVDGKLSSHRREQIAISSEEDFERVDELRARSDAVMIGVGTVVADDPQLGLTSEALRADRRARGAPPQPARVVADSTARTPPDAAILDDIATTYILVAEAAPEARLVRLREAGAEILTVGSERVSIGSGLAALEERGIDQLMVEGGGELLFSLFDGGHVDELTVFVGSRLIGGRDAPTLIDGEGWVEDFPDLDLTDVRRLDGGVLLSYVL